MSKREKSGFLYPDPISPYPLRCITLHIPDTPRYRAAFWGHLWQLARAATWYQNSPVPAGELVEVSNYWLEILWPDYQKYLAHEDDCEDCMDCCPDPITRFTENGFQEISTDNGETWEANAADPRFLPIPFLPRPEATGDVKRCNAANSVRQLMEQATTTLIDTAGAWGAIQTLVDLILSIIAWVFPGLGTVAAFFISIVVSALFFAGRAAFIAAMTPAVFEAYQCILYCHMNDDGMIDQNGWVGIKLDIYEQIPGIAGHWLWGWVSSLGVSGINASTGMFTGTTADCTDCTCEEGCTLDAWNIRYEGLGVFGEVVSRNEGTGEIVVQSTGVNTNGEYYIYLGTDNPFAQCCYWVSSVPAGGFIHTYAISDCGVEINDGALEIVPEPVNQCLGAVQMISSSPFSITITFGECP